MSDEQERKRFEAWLTTGYYGGLDGPSAWDERRNCYVDYAHHLAWKGWQAAIRSMIDRGSAGGALQGATAPKKP